MWLVGEWKMFFSDSGTDLTISVQERSHERDLNFMFLFQGNKPYIKKGLIFSISVCKSESLLITIFITWVKQWLNTCILFFVCNIVSVYSHVSVLHVCHGYLKQKVSDIIIQCATQDFFTGHWNSILRGVKEKEFCMLLLELFCFHLSIYSPSSKWLLRQIALLHFSPYFAIRIDYKGLEGSRFQVLNNIYSTMLTYAVCIVSTSILKKGV